MKRGNFNLRKLLTNEKSLFKEWKKEGFKIYQLNSCELYLNALKVLGITWDVYCDCISLNIFSLVKFLKERKKAKCLVLQTSEKVYDPTGIITPFAVRLTILF